MNTIRTKRITNFKQGMTPNLYGDGFTRLEHFDTVTEQARPFRKLVPSTMTGYKNISKFVRKGTGLFALALTDQVTARLNILQWNSGTKIWEIYQSINADGQPAEFLHYHAGYFWGLWKGTDLWKIELADITTSAVAISYSTYCDPITHSKDGIMYFATDNKIHKVSSTGTPTANVLTLPNTNFIITSIEESGDFITIAGYDSKSNLGTVLLWDRDTSVVDLTAKYDIGEEIPTHVVSIDVNTFVISFKNGNLSSNSPFTEGSTLIIRQLMNTGLKIIHQFRFTSGTLGGKYIDNGNLYFNAAVYFPTDTATHYCTFQLNGNGQVSLAQNVKIEDGVGSRSDWPGLFREGDGFWIGGGADGAWHTTDVYPTANADSLSAIETAKIRSDDLSQDVGFVGMAISCEPLPTDGKILVSARLNEQTSWTTLKTYSTDSGTKFAISKIEARNALKPTSGVAGLNQCNEFQLRVESIGGAVITGIQYSWEEIKTNSYG